MIIVNRDDPNREITKTYAVCEFCGDEIDMATGSDEHIEKHCIVLNDLREDRRFQFRLPMELDTPAKKIALEKKEARAAVLLACSKLGIQVEKRGRAPVGDEGMGSSHVSGRRSVAADSQVT